MWIPNVQNNLDDLKRIPRWERLLFPVTWVWLLYVLARASWQFWLYPESHAHPEDLVNDPNGARPVAGFRAYRARVGVGRRLLEKLHLVKFDRGPFGRGPWGDAK